MMGLSGRSTLHSFVTFADDALFAAPLSAATFCAIAAIFVLAASKSSSAA